MDLKLKLLPYQDAFVFSEKKYSAFVAAIGTGKTLCAILKMLNEMQKYRMNLGLVVRNEFTDLKDSTIRDFEDYTGLHVGEDKDVKFPNGSILMFRHGAEINVLKNINLGAIYIEQAEEFETDEQFTFLRDRLRRQKTGRKMFIVANTNGHNWIWRLWKNRELANSSLSEATTFDNPYLPKDYIEDKKDMQRTHPKHFNRYVMNSWEDVDIVDSVIQYSWYENALHRQFFGEQIRKLLTLDVARKGGDEIPCFYMENTDIKAAQIWKDLLTMDTAGRTHIMAQKYKVSLVAVDAIGVGAGVADRIEEMSRGLYRVLRIVGSKQRDIPEKYLNLRSRMWWEAGERFSENEISLSYNDDILKEQLCSVRYEIKSGQIKIADKEEIRKILHTSPDRADAYVQGLWALNQTPLSREKHTFESIWKKPAHFSAMAG